MSKLTDRDMRFPLSDVALSKLQGHIKQLSGFQATAVDDTILLTHNGNPIITQKMRIREAYCIVPVTPGTGESMVVDLQKSTNGGGSWATVLSATKTVNSSSTANSQILLSLDSTKVELGPGDMLRVSLDYTVGTPTPIKNMAFVVEPDMPQSEGLA